MTSGSGSCTINETALSPVILKISLTEGAPAGENVFSSILDILRGCDPLRATCKKPSR